MSKATQILASVFAGVQIVKEILDEITGEKAASQEELANVTYGRALRILDERVLSGQSLEEFLSKKYLAVYLIGRIGKRLNAVRLDAVTLQLQHYHLQLNRAHDQALADWYETLGKGRRIPLQRLLAVCPEVTCWQIDCRFIAFALGVDQMLNFTNFRGDLERLKNI